MWPGRPDGSGRRGAKVGEQTRFYGDTYDWAFQNATVASLLAASVFFPRGLRRKCFAGGGVATDVPQPGGKEISDQLGECTASLRVRELWFRLRRAGINAFVPGLALRRAALSNMPWQGAFSRLICRC